jgi:hypothetical protein
MRKTSEVRSEPFLEVKKPREFHSKLFLEEKKLWNSVLNNFWKRKNLGKRRLLLAASLNTLFRRIPFPSVSFRVTEWTLPNNSASHGMSTLFCGITKNFPSLFHRIFSERNFDGLLDNLKNPSYQVGVTDHSNKR